MIVGLISFFIFAAGYLAAAVNWAEFLSDAFSFQNVKHTGRFCACITAILLLYIIPLWGVIKVYENAQSNSCLMCRKVYH